MKIELIRFSVSDTETEGTLTVGRLVFRTIEPPWLNNLKNKSCIPNGTYKLRRFLHDRWGPVYWLENKANNIYWQGEKTEHRTQILIHPANFASELQGCIAIGDGRHFRTDYNTGKVAPCVNNSRATHAKVDRILQSAAEEDHVLVISQRIIK